MPRGVYPRTLRQRRAASAKLRQMWRDPETRARWSAMSSQKLAQRNRDEAFRAAVHPKVAAANRSPEKKAKIRATRRRNFSVPAPLARFYRKLRIAFGKARARTELRRYLLELHR